MLFLVLLAAVLGGAVMPASGHAAGAAGGTQSITGTIGPSLAVVPPAATLLSPPVSGETVTTLPLEITATRASGLWLRTAAWDGRPRLADGSPAAHPLTIRAEGIERVLSGAGVALGMTQPSEPKAPQSGLGIVSRWEHSDSSDVATTELAFDVAPGF